MTISVAKSNRMALCTNDNWLTSELLSEFACKCYSVAIFTHIEFGLCTRLKWERRKKKNNIKTYRIGQVCREDFMHVSQVQRMCSKVSSQVEIIGAIVGGIMQKPKELERNKWKAQSPLWSSAANDFYSTFYRFRYLPHESTAPSNDFSTKKKKNTWTMGLGHIQWY